MDLDANEMMRWTTLSNHDVSFFLFPERNFIEGTDSRLYLENDFTFHAGDDVVLQLLAPEAASSKAFYPKGLEGGRKTPKCPFHVLSKWEKEMMMMMMNNEQWTMNNEQWTSNNEPWIMNDERWLWSEWAKMITPQTA